MQAPNAQHDASGCVSTHSKQASTYYAANPTADAADCRVHGSQAERVYISTKMQALPVMLLSKKSASQAVDEVLAGAVLFNTQSCLPVGATLSINRTPDMPRSKGTKVMNGIYSSNELQATNNLHQKIQPNTTQIGTGLPGFAAHHLGDHCASQHLLIETDSVGKMSDRPVHSHARRCSGPNSIQPVMSNRMIALP